MVATPHQGATIAALASFWSSRLSERPDDGVEKAAIRANELGQKG